MYTYTEEEVLNCLTNAENLNAAIKRFLKTESSGGDDGARFVKAFRTAAKSGKELPLKNFVSKALPRYEQELYVVVKSAFDQPVSDIVEKIFEQFAESFNGTYTLENDEFQFVDEAAFHKISTEALQEIDSLMKEKQLPEQNFMRNAVALSLFEPLVIERIQFPSS